MILFKSENFFSQRTRYMFLAVVVGQQVSVGNDDLSIIVSVEPAPITNVNNWARSSFLCVVEMCVI